MEIDVNNEDNCVVRIKCLIPDELSEYEELVLIVFVTLPRKEINTGFVVQN